MRKRTADFLQGMLITLDTQKSNPNVLQSFAEPGPRLKRKSARQLADEPSVSKHRSHRCVECMMALLQQSLLVTQSHDSLEVMSSLNQS
jgi:hypothetical protein